MFDTIDWYDFITLMAPLTVGYYLVSLLIFYRKEVLARLSKPPVQKKEAYREENSSTQSMPDDVLGPALGNTGKEQAYDQQAQDLLIADAQQVPEPFLKADPSPKREVLLIGSVADLVQEIKTVIDLVTEYGSDKAEAESLLRSLLDRYPHVGASHYRKPITEYIYQAQDDHFDFKLPVEEVEALWKKDNKTTISS